MSDARINVRLSHAAFNGLRSYGQSPSNTVATCLTIMGQKIARGDFEMYNDALNRAEIVKGKSDGTSTKMASGDQKIFVVRIASSDLHTAKEQVFNDERTLKDLVLGVVHGLLESPKQRAASH